MKKLNLQLGSIKEMLTKEQMKKVSGGYGCNVHCFDEFGRDIGGSSVFNCDDDELTAAICSAIATAVDGTCICQ